MRKDYERELKKQLKPAIKKAAMDANLGAQLYGCSRGTEPYHSSRLTRNKPTPGNRVLYTHKPCFICAKMLVNVGIKTIITAHVYPDPNTDQLFHDVGVRLLYI